LKIFNSKFKNFQTQNMLKIKKNQKKVGKKRKKRLKKRKKKCGEGARAGAGSSGPKTRAGAN
jgi:ribosomal protein L15